MNAFERWDSSAHPRGALRRRHRDLSSGNTAAASVPASVTVPAGATSATFTVTTPSVNSSTTVTISGTYDGTAQSGTLTVTSRH